jgi:hypothetical protein
MVPAGASNDDIITGSDLPVATRRLPAKERPYARPFAATGSYGSDYAFGGIG